MLNRARSPVRRMNYKRAGIEMGTFPMALPMQCCEILSYIMEIDSMPTNSIFKTLPLENQKVTITKRGP
jgi:hypothetical protein